MEREPLNSVTIVIPVWDAYVGTLGQAVASVRDDAPDARIVVVDNASSTPVPDLEGIEVIRTAERLTVGAARNVGLDAVRTEYTLVLDADDRLLPGTLSFLHGRLVADPAVSLAATSILEADTGRRHRSPRRFVSALVAVQPVFAVVGCVWALIPIQSCALFRTQAARDGGGYPDAEWGDDWVVAVSLGFSGRVEVHDRPGRLYGSAPDSLSGRRRTFRDLISTTALVRDRVREDPRAPRWIQVSAPAIKAVHMVAIFVLRPVYLAFRRLAGAE